MVNSSMEEEMDMASKVLSSGSNNNLRAIQLSIQWKKNL